VGAHLLPETLNILYLYVQPDLPCRLAHEASAEEAVFVHIVQLALQICSVFWQSSIEALTLTQRPQFGSVCFTTSTSIRVYA
jgi:hypothetical protein